MSPQCQHRPVLLCPVSADDVQLINTGDNVIAVTESDHGADTVQTMFCVGQTKYHSQENIHKELILKRRVLVRSYVIRNSCLPASDC